MNRPEGGSRGTRRTRGSAHYELLIAERGDWIDARGLPGRDQARAQRDRENQNRDQQERNGIGGETP